MNGALNPIVLQDWRRRLFELYSRVRSNRDPRSGWEDWKAERDRLFAAHAASPLPAPRRPTFTALPVFPYDRSLRVTAAVLPAPHEAIELATSDGRSYPFTRFAQAQFTLAGNPCALELYWLHGYAGGLFVPFTDATSGDSTYGAGRYLLDTVKGADLGLEGERLILDFNFAYNPSCSYDPDWSCPLPSGRNCLAHALRGGELAPD